MSMVSSRLGLPKILTLLRDIHPYGFVIEGVFVGIKPTEGRVAL